MALDFARHTARAADVISRRHQAERMHTIGFEAEATILATQEDANLVSRRKDDVDPRIAIHVAERKLRHVEKYLKVSLESEETVQRGEEVICTTGHREARTNLSVSGEGSEFPHLGDEEPGLRSKFAIDDAKGLKTASGKGRSARSLV